MDPSLILEQFFISEREQSVGLRVPNFETEACVSIVTEGIKRRFLSSYISCDGQSARSVSLW